MSGTINKERSDYDNAEDEEIIQRVIGYVKSKARPCRFTVRELRHVAKKMGS